VKGVEFFGPAFRVGERSNEKIECFARRAFLKLVQLLAGCLGVVSVYECCLVGGVKNEPKLDARVGKSHGYRVGSSEFERFSKVWVFVDIDYDPVLVVARAAALAFCLEASLTFVDGVSYERERCPMTGIENDNYSFSMQPMEVGEVGRFGCFSFGKNQDSSFWWRRRWLSGWT
jgi:hypothetical protein